MRIVVLTGAGISAESGIRTFRGSDGLWEGHRIEDVASPQGFRRDPKLVYKFYNDRRRHLLEPAIQPNAAHHALARLEAAFGDDFLLVTQNIDDLHQRAGSKRILPMHGELRKARCMSCEAVVPWDDDFDDTNECPQCGSIGGLRRSVGGLRPHVVWFGETPLFMDQIYAALEECDLFAAIGTSGVVYPAAGLVQIANSVNAHTIELNLEESAVHSVFQEKRYGPATEVVTQWVDGLLK